MFKWLKHFGNWISRVFNWLFGGRKADVFLIIFVTIWIGILVHVSLPQAILEPFIRWSGAFLVILGLGVVAKGLLDMRVLLGLPSVRQIIRDKWRRFPKFQQDHRYKTSGGKIELTGISAKVGKLKATATLPDRVYALRLEVWGLLMIFAGMVLVVGSAEIARLLA